METEFIVISKAEKMPSSCWGKYRRVAVCEVIKGTKPKMISNRARGMVRIIEEWRCLNVGVTSRCAFQVAMREAYSLAETLNKGSRQ